MRLSFLGTAQMETATQGPAASAAFYRCHQVPRSRHTQVINWEILSLELVFYTFKITFFVGGVGLN